MLLEGFVSRRADEIRLRLPAYDRLANGAKLAFGVAPLIVAAVWAGGWAVGLESVMAVATTAAIAAALAGPIGAVGLGLMLTAERRAAKREIRIDIAERLILRPAAEPAVLRTPQTVRVAAARLFAWRLELVDADGHVTTLLSRVPRGSGRRLANDAERLAAALDAPRVDIPQAARRASGLVPPSARTWAALTVAPLDGVLAAYSLWALATARDPFVRFWAKQSLLLLAIESALLVLIVGCVGAPLVLLFDAAGVRAAGVTCPLFVLAIARVAVRVTAAIRAHRGEVWVLPGIGWVTKRWVPSEE